MEMLLWIVAGFFALFLLFATAESSAQLLSTPKVQLVLDRNRQRSSIARRLLPRQSGELRSSLSHCRMLCVAALAAALALLTLEQPAIGLVLSASALALAFVLPTLLAAGSPRRVLRLLLPVARFGCALVLPLTWPRRVLFRRIKSRAGRDAEAEEDAQEIEAYLDAAEETGLFAPGEAEMVRLVVEFGDTVVREVMTPRVDMVCVERKATLGSFRALAGKHKLSRFPVVDGIIDRVVGVAHIKSLLSQPAERDETTAVAEIMTAPIFVPESKRVSSLLRDFQRKKQQLAIVVDEYGGTAGLVTLEDIVEELVGEIEDEHEPEEEESEIVQQPDGSLVVLGHVDVDEVEKLLGLALDDEAYETVSGLALSYLKRIPVPGEKFTTRGMEVEILEADEKSILKMRLVRLQAENNDEDGDAGGGGGGDA